MSSHPTGLRFSSYNQTSQKIEEPSNPGDDFCKANSKNMASRDQLTPETRSYVTQKSTPTNSNRNTLIIHDDLYKNSFEQERPRSFGTDHVLKEILGRPDYTQNSSFLKQLVIEMKPGHRISGGAISRNHGNYSQTILEKEGDKNDSITNEETVVAGGNISSLSKLKSKSQPDLSRIVDIDLETIEVLMKENLLLKEQLHHCYKKVAKTKKLEEEITNIYRVHEELVQSCERREKLEKAARARLQDLNKALKEEVNMYRSQLMAPSEHQMVIAQLFQQNKDLTAAKERQDIELAAQRATLQEQRKHIGILDKALKNSQHNSRCLEEELRKKQFSLINHLQPHSNDTIKDSHRCGSSSSTDAKWIPDRTNQFISRLDIDSSKLEQRRLNEVAYRQNLAKSIEKTSQESQRMLDEARQDKRRYMEEFHSAQKKVSELQNHLKDLEGHVVEKDALIRALQTKAPNACSSSFDSWPLNTSNASFTTTIDQSFGPSHHISSSSSSLLPNSDPVGNFPIYTPSYTDSDQQMLLSNHQSTSYSPGGSFVGLESRALAHPVNYSVLLDSPSRSELDLRARTSMEDHLIKKEFDAQLRKVSSAASCTNNIIMAQIETSREITKSCRDMPTNNDNETFY